MLERCDFRTCNECSCADDQCRVQNIGVIQKPRPAPCNANPYQYAAIGLFALLCVLWGVTVGMEQQKTIDRDRQEQIAWTE